MSDLRKSASSTLIGLWEEHTTQEFIHKDVDATMRTMSAAPHVIVVPLTMGGRGWNGVREYYSRHFIGQTPDDLQLDLLSRTEDTARVVDEMVVSFTHDIETPWILPGIAPTGRRVEVPVVAVVSFLNGKIESEHIYWDQASVLAQVGLLPSSGLPVTAAMQAKALLDPAVPLNTVLTSID
jgi:carboxymethylenebutenolidase